ASELSAAEPAGEAGPGGEIEQRGEHAHAERGVGGGGPGPGDAFDGAVPAAYAIGPAAGDEEEARDHPQHEDEKHDGFADAATREETLQQAARAAREQQVEDDEERKGEQGEPPAGERIAEES